MRNEKISVYEDALHGVEDVINMTKAHNFLLGTDGIRLILKDIKLGEIIYDIKWLNPDKSTGPNDLSPWALKEEIHETSPISEIFSETCQGRAPED